MDVKTIRPLARQIGWFYVVTATGVFTGYAPMASGTVGTLVGIPPCISYFSKRDGYLICSSLRLSLESDFREPVKLKRTPDSKITALL